MENHNMQEMINNSLEILHTSGQVKEMIDNATQKMVKEIISDSLRSYGTIGKELKKHIESSVNIDFQQLSLPEYNAVILDMIKGNIVSSLKESTQGILLENLNEMLKPAPKEITVQGIIDLCKTEWIDETGCNCDEVNIEVEIEKYKNCEDYFDLKIWQNGKTYGSLSTREKSPTIDMFVNGDGKIAILRDMRNNNGTSNHGLEATLFQMYGAATLITDIATCDPLELDTTADEHF